MAQPIIYQINAWDATKPQTISFAYSGNQVLKNQVVIRNNLTNVIVYDKTETNFQLKHTIDPSNSNLINGTCYNIQLRVFDKDDTPSPYSKTEIFYCFASPAFSFQNCTQNQIIQSPYFEATLAYSQPQGEPLNNYQFILYNEHQLEIMRSAVLYDTASLTYNYTNLEDKSKYYFRAIGETLNHMVVDTGMMTVSVQYIRPSIYAVVDLQNLAKQGSIRIRSNIVSITGKSNPSPPIYIDNNEVDLRADQSWVTFDEGFEVSGDFTLQLKARQLIHNKIPLILSNGKHRIELTYRTGSFKSQNNKRKGYFELYAKSGIANYYQVSNLVDLPIEDVDSLYIWIRRINHLYELKAVNLNPRIYYAYLNGDILLDGAYKLDFLQK